MGVLAPLVTLIVGCVLDKWALPGVSSCCRRLAEEKESEDEMPQNKRRSITWEASGRRETLTPELAFEEATTPNAKSSLPPRSATWPTSNTFQAFIF